MVNSLKFKFILIFIVLGGAISFSMYIPYTRYIKQTYISVMAHVLDLVVEQVAEFENTETLKEARLAHFPAYWELVWKLDGFRKEYNMKYVYYMIRREDGQVALVAVSDDAETTELEYHEPDYIDPVLRDAWRTGQFTTSKAPVTNEFGTTISAYLPMLKNGETEGVVGVDYDISYVNRLMLNAVFALVAALVLSALAALLLALHINQTIVFPLREMKTLADAMAHTRFDVDIPRFRKDELGAMQRSMIETRNNLQKALTDLQAERDEITAMKDNLKTGVFLMNKDYVIQGHFSKALEKVLADSNLEGKNFTRLLEESFSAKELGLVQDYFDMVQTRAMPQKKLESINPLSELNYKSPQTKEEKTLRCGFAPVEREGEVFVLGTIEDITAETKLKKRLAEEEHKRQEEMSALFEVIHVAPSVFSDFIADVEYNFDQVMGILKDSAVSSSEALVRIYQLIHAVKSDAYILGLKSFGDRLHGLEGEIKALRDAENQDVPLNDMLQLTVELEQLLREKDKLVSTVDTVRSYKAEEKGEQDVLVESLKRACEKVSADLDKKLRFKIDHIDSGVLQNAPRRELKDILTQIVRNAVYHGIETPEEREKLGKSETGVIGLSVQGDGSSIRALTGHVRPWVQHRRDRGRPRRPGHRAQPGPGPGP
jgi:HAMP domain-containing protein